jgi:hypothetical protein
MVSGKNEKMLHFENQKQKRKNLTQTESRINVSDAKVDGKILIHLQGLRSS